MAWTATLTDATKSGGQITLDILISDGTDSQGVSLVYTETDPDLNVERLRADIAHYAKSLGKWEAIQSYIGRVIHSGT